MSSATAPADGSKVVKLTTSDNAELPVEREVAERSILIKNLLEDLGGDNDESIPIPNVCIVLSHPLPQSLNVA